MCDIEPLLNFDVFATKDGTEQFQLTRQCNQVAQPFDQYCFIPPETRLATTSTCNIPANTADFVFQRALSGQIRTLRDLPLLFQSFPKREDSSNIWIPLDPVQVNPTQIFVFPTRYDGFRPIPDSVTRMVVSNIAQHVMLCFLSVNSDTNLQFYALDANGFLRLQFTTNGVALTTTILDLRHNCYVNGNGSLQFALLADTLFSLQPSGIWIAVDVPNIIDVLLFAETLIYVRQNALRFVNPVFPDVGFTGPILWACFTQNHDFVLVAEFISSTIWRISAVSLASGLITTQWIAVSSLLAAGIFSAVCLAGTINATNTVRVLVTNNANQSLQVSLPPASSTAVVALVAFVQRFFANGVWFRPSDVTVNFAVGEDAVLTVAPPPNVTPNTRPILALSENTQDTWTILGGLLWRLRQRALPWTQSAASVYLASDAVINDEYANTAPNNRLALWYHGTTRRDVPVEITFGAVFAVSRHLRFRWILDVVAISPDAFPYVQSHLEQINDYYLLTSTTFATKLYENANVVVEEDEIIWQSNTRDQSSDPSTFHNWISRVHPLATSNGLYLLFHDTEDNTVRVVFNLFNSAQFAKYCQQDTEFLSRAVQTQRDFCFRNLRVAEGLATAFVDPRCSCIGGGELFDAMFPSLALESQTKGRMISNLPCLLSDCGAAFLEGPEQSNAYRLVSEQCKQDTVICSDIVNIDPSANFNLKAFRLDQNCGLNPTACLRNEECPIGSICINGTCALACTTDASCKTAFRDPFATCDASGRCMYGVEAKANASQPTWIIVTVVCVVLALIFLLLILALFVKPKQKL